MTEDRRNGIATRGQITHERVGGWDEVVIAIRDTLALAVIAALRAAFIVALSLLAGPWALVVIVPRAIEAAARWFEPDGEPMGRYNAAAWGALALLALALLPEAALIWWPWRWQARRATAWGLLWPAFWPGAIAAAAVLRAVALAALVRAWREVWYLRNRLRQEVMAPTVSGATYTQADLHAVRVPGVVNPHRDPGAEPEPQAHSYGDIIIDNVPAEAPQARVLASDPVSGEPSVAIGGNGGGRHTAQARIPTSLLGGDRQHVRDLLRILHNVYGALAEGEQLSRANLRRHGLSNNQARDLSAWFREQGYATIDRANQHEITATGARYLSVALDGLTEARQRIE